MTVESFHDYNRYIRPFTLILFHAPARSHTSLKEARRKGYALAATVMWAQAVLQERLVPLYSGDASNTASLHLADAAGYRAFARLAPLNDETRREDASQGHHWSGDAYDSVCTRS